MAEQWFLKIDDIEGESTNARHAKEIDVESWSFGASVAEGGGYGGGGGGSARPSLDPFAFQATMSGATPRLFKACVTGTRHQKAVLTGVRSGGGGGIEFMTYALEDVTVTSARHGDGDGGPPYDAFTLAFRKVTVTYKPQKPTGGAGTPVTVSYTVR